MLSIGQLAKRTGVKVPTIRYYEELGLIAPPHRSAGNQRRYEPDVVERLNFIRHGRDLGLKIEAIRDLLELSGHPDTPCGRADEIARAHLNDVRDKIARLQRLETELTRIAGQCSNGLAGDCYVLQSLRDHGLCLDEH